MEKLFKFYVSSLFYFALNNSQLQCCWKRLYCISLEKKIGLALVADITKSNFAPLASKN